MSAINKPAADISAAANEGKKDGSLPSLPVLSASLTSPLPPAYLLASAFAPSLPGLAETGGVAGALAKEREARGVSADDGADGSSFLLFVSVAVVQVSRHHWG